VTARPGSRADRERLISEVTQCPLKWSADKLGWKLRLSDDQRTRLKIRTIGAMGITKDQRAERRKAKQAACNAPSEPSAKPTASTAYRSIYILLTIGALPLLPPRRNRAAHE
jgi:hypothetical protein